MGAKQSITAENGRARAYSSSDVPSSNSSHSDRTAAMTMRYHGYSASANGGSRVAPMASQHLRSRTRSTGGSEEGSGIRPQSLYQSGVNTPGSQESGNSTPDDSPGERNRSNGSARLLIGSLPSHLSSHLFEGFKCPVCSKFVPTDEMDLHLVMCLTKPRVTYNEDVLVKDAGECAICLVELMQGDTIARLPCLCIYHKGCIDEWFDVNRSCPEHPSN